MKNEIREKGLTVYGHIVRCTDFRAGSPYEEFPFKTRIRLEGVTGDMIPTVIFGAEEVESGNFADIACAVEGGVDIYARRIPDGDVLLSAIMVVPQKRTEAQ